MKIKEKLISSPKAFLVFIEVIRRFSYFLAPDPLQTLPSVRDNPCKNFPLLLSASFYKKSTMEKRHSDVGIENLPTEGRDQHPAAFSQVRLGLVTVTQNTLHVTL